jgi:hypothetical protein
MIQSPISGRLSLAEQELKCGEIQNATISKLVHMSELAVEDGVKLNLGVFAEMDDPAEEVPVPKFVRVPPGGNKATIIAEQLAAGRTLIFDEKIFASDQEAQVLGFR